MTKQEKIHLQGLVRQAADRLKVGDYANYQDRKRQATVVWCYVDSSKFDRMVKKLMKGT